MNIQASIRPQATGELLWFGNTLVSINVSSSSGADGICVVEHWMPLGEAPPLHIHRREDEVFHILSGRMRFNVGGRTVIAGAGETILAPKGVPHCFRVESEDGAHCLTITKGADFETMVVQTSRPADRIELPEASAPTPEMIEMLARCCADNHIDILGPPLA